MPLILALKLSPGPAVAGLLFVAQTSIHIEAYTVGYSLQFAVPFSYYHLTYVVLVFNLVGGRSLTFY